MVKIHFFELKQIIDSLSGVKIDMLREGTTNERQMNYKKSKNEKFFYAIVFCAVLLCFLAELVKREL